MKSDFNEGDGLAESNKCVGVGVLAAVTKSLEEIFESIMRKYYFVAGARLTKEFQVPRESNASKAVALMEKFFPNFVSRVIGEVKLVEWHENE